MTDYTCGLAFTSGGKLVLIRKTHPAWQAGRYNGVGGKIEEPLDDKPFNLEREMSREFLEETGVAIPPLAWGHFLTITGDDFAVHYLACEQECAAEATTMTDERVARHEVAYWLQFGFLVPDLHWIIPLALQRGRLTEPLVARVEPSQVSARLGATQPVDA